MIAPAETFDFAGLLQRYQGDYLGFAVDWFDIDRRHVWSKMVEIANSVRDNQKTAVKACHSSSKTYTAARIALAYLLLHGPRATVITTAPTDNLVAEVLWREIRGCYGAAKWPIGGKLTTQKLELDPQWFAMGFSTRPDTVTQQATNIQGFHNDYVLVIFDEAAGILPQIWEAAESLITNDRCRWLAIGNPTSAFGRFANCFNPDSGWHQITISVKDSPNYQQDREIVPGLSGRAFEERIRRTYGETSNYYRSRCLGELPTFAEGAIYGKEIQAARSMGRIINIPAVNTSVVHTCWDLGVGDATAIWFFQLVGQEIHWIDYYERSNEGLAHYAKVLDDKRQANGWIYGRHYAPHDIESRELGTGTTRRDTAANLGINFDVIPRTSLEEGIEAVRQVLPRSWFDINRCNDGLKMLCEYHWRKIERLSEDDRPVYSVQPEHDWTSHGADAIRSGAQAIISGRVSPAGVDHGGDYNELADFYSKRAS